MLSVKLEEKLAGVVRDESWSQQDEDKEYERSLLQVMSELRCMPLAGGNIRVGDYILLGTTNHRPSAHDSADNLLSGFRYSST